MNIRKIHQLLIGSAIAMALVFALRSIVLFVRGQGGGLLVHAVLAVAVAVALGLYLRRFREKLRAPSDDPPKDE